MAVEMLSSKENKIIKNVIKLTESAKERREQRLFVADGVRLCFDAAISGCEIELTLFTKDAENKYADYLKDIFAVSKQKYCITDELASKISDTKSPQGVISVCRMLDKKANIVNIIKDGFFLVLEEIQDPSNMGAIFRSAEAFGISGVILIGNCCDIYAPKTVRASMGAVFRLPIFRADGAENIVDIFKSNQVRTFAAVVNHEDAKLVCDCQLGKGCAIFIGNEGNGLLDNTVALCDEKITIPMRGRAESLNAAVAASVLIWEMVKNER